MGKHRKNYHFERKERKICELTFGNGKPNVSLTDNQQLLSYPGASGDIQHKIAVREDDLREAFPYTGYLPMIISVHS